ncbi:hypothetical protein Syun_026422 [Stephania yunnanensis]|uniref:Uncharacterized protein n=1 Tax=Stephania yunnanensis TaxID=152371 RepID=A0AAP0EYW4_9MAGN
MLTGPYLEIGKVEIQRTRRCGLGYVAFRCCKDLVNGAFKEDNVETVDKVDIRDENKESNNEDDYDDSVHDSDNGIDAIDLPEGPNEGMIFEIIDEVKATFKRHTKAKGFGVRLRSIHKKGNVTWKYVLVCVRQESVRAGGTDQLTFGDKDVRNYMGVSRRLRLSCGDAEAILQYFAKN